MINVLKAVAKWFEAFFSYQGKTTDNIDKKWEKLPTLSEYTAKYPEFSDANGQSVKCRFCGSSNIKYQPLFHSRDRREKHFCSLCKRSLYKSYADF